MGETNTVTVQLVVRQHLAWQFSSGRRGRRKSRHSLRQSFSLSRHLVAASVVSRPNIILALNLYDGELVESGGGMTAKIYIRADSDELVVDVTGANTSTTYTATVRLWSARNPTAAASGAVATLAESWTDSGSWSSNQKLGSLAALTAGGKSVTPSASGKT